MLYDRPPPAVDIESDRVRLQRVWKFLVVDMDFKWPLLASSPHGTFSSFTLAKYVVLVSSPNKALFE